MEASSFCRNRRNDDQAVEARREAGHLASSR